MGVDVWAIITTIVLFLLGSPIAWLINKVIKLESSVSTEVAKIYASMEALKTERELKLANVALQIAQIQSNCARHQVWDDSMQQTINRADKNVALLCQQAGIKPSE